MSSLCISLFGKIEVRRGTTSLHDCRSAKARELLCYLLLHRERAHPREKLASVLWSRGSTAQSRAYLRKALWNLQRVFNVEAETPLLNIDGQWIRIDSDADVWLDVDLFERAHAQVRGISGNDLDAEDAKVLIEAVHLYTGDLLENWYQDWCLFERERLQTMYLAMLDRVVCYCRAHGDYETGLEYGLQILHVDHAHERTHRHLMHLRYLAGDRTGALRQYEQCATALREELGVAPSERTDHLYHQIQAGHVPDSITAAPNREQSTLVQGLHRIRRLQQKMSTLQVQIQREIEALESSLQ